MSREKPKPLRLKDVPKRDLQFFLSYFTPHRALFVADLCFAVFVSVIDLAFPVVSRYTINRVLPQYAAAPQTTVCTFLVIIAACFALYVLRTGAQWFITYFGHLFGVYVETDMRRDIFAHLQRQSYRFFDANRTGTLMARASTDLFEVSELAHHGPEDLLISLLTLIGAFCIMLRIRWQLALVVFAALPLMILRTSLSRKSIMNTSRSVKEKTGEINSALESSISGIRVTKVFANEEYEQRKFGENNGAFLSAKRQYYKAMAGFHSRMEFTTHILNVVVLAVGGWYIIRGSMTVGDLVAALMFVAAFLQPIRRLTNFVEQFSIGMAGFMRFAEIMRTHDEIAERNDAIPLTAARGDIRYEHVNFAYDNGVAVLRDVNLAVRAGQTVALVGPSGGGKTSLCHLLPRFYEFQSGSITFDGYDIRDLTLQSLRRHIGIVQQDVFLFAGTVRENIAYGRPDATDDEVYEAARRAEIYDDIMRLPNGFASLVGERGIKLSGGQKQRIAIARVFLKDPPVLILDEATSALDSVTELKIQGAFDKLSKGRTTFVIAHRLSTIRAADLIAVIDDNGIVEHGTHDDLMALRGAYYQLYTAQYGR